jgi:hypothetical protein
MHRQLLADGPNHWCDEQRGMRLSDLPQDIVVELFHLASHHFRRWTIQTGGCSP